MTVLLAILGTAALFVLFALLKHRGCDHCGSAGKCDSCGTPWWKEKDHVA